MATNGHVNGDLDEKENGSNGSLNETHYYETKEGHTMTGNEDVEHNEHHDHLDHHGNTHWQSMRIDGDGEDHEHEPPMTFRRAMSLLAMAFLWVGSQIPLYLFGSIPPYIYGDIGGEDRWVWFVLAGLLSLAGVCPFVGSLADLLGRRYVALIAAGLLVIGTVVATTAHTMNTFIAGMALVGGGAGMAELTALAVVSELAPTRKRGTYVSILIFTILPFIPSGVYAQLIAYHSSWRYVGIIVCVWNGIGMILTAVFYFPPPRVNSSGKSKKQILREIDYVGGFLSIVGLVLLMAGLEWGGYQYPWHSAHVLVPLLLGVAFIIAFVCWEAWGAPYPMFPARLKQDPRVLILTLIITFVSGVSFFAAILFWPTQAYNVYGHEPALVGLRAFPIGMAILVGACVTLVLLSVFRGRNKELMIMSSIFMTAGIGGLAAARRDNEHIVWGLLILGGFGIGGIVVPASIITTIICPDDLIATISALTLSIRVLGGCIGYCAYYNVFVSKFKVNAIKYIGDACVNAGVYDQDEIKEIILLTASSLLDKILELPGINGDVTKWKAIVYAGQVAYADSYQWVYLASIAAGCVSIICSLLLGDIGKYMDDHVAVVMH